LTASRAWYCSYQTIALLAVSSLGRKVINISSPDSTRVCLLSNPILAGENSTSYLYITIYPPRINEFLQVGRCHEIEVSIPSRILPTPTGFGAPCANIPITKVKFELNIRDSRYEIFHEPVELSCACLPKGICRILESFTKAVPEGESLGHLIAVNRVLRVERIDSVETRHSEA
jgi:hypothetical protein